MILGIPVAAITYIGGWMMCVVLLLVLLRALIRGDLVSRRTHEDTLHDMEMWRAAHMVSEQARQEERDQKRELMVAARLGAAVMTSLPQVPPDDETNQQ